MIQRKKAQPTCPAHLSQATGHLSHLAATLSHPDPANGHQGHKDHQGHLSPANLPTGGPPARCPTQWPKPFDESHKMKSYKKTKKVLAFSIWFIS